MKTQTIVRLLDLVNRFLNGEKLSTKEIEKRLGRILNILKI